MKKLLIASFILICSMALAQEAAKTTPKHAGAKSSAKMDATKAKNAFTPNDIQWGPTPPFIPPGASMVVLEGNPMGATGDYTIRVKTPDGYKVPPHWHPKRENVTIITGALKVGMGDKFDESKMTTFPAGSFAYLDPSMHHYVMASGETIVQIHGMAPVKFNYIDPNDDPSKKKK